MNQPRIFILLLTSGIFARVLPFMHWKKEVIGYCPKASEYMKANKECVFAILENGDYKDNNALCETHSAKLVEINNSTHLDELCRFVTSTINTDLEEQTKYRTKAMFYLGGHFVSTIQKYRWDGTGQILNIKVKHNKDGINKHCLILHKFDMGRCWIESLECNKETWALCQFKEPDICKENNGGCEHHCLPFGYRQRKCICFPGYAMIDHKCTVLYPEPAPTTEACSVGFSEYGWMCYILNIESCNNISSQAVAIIDHNDLNNTCAFVKDNLGPTNEQLLLVRATRQGNDFAIPGTDNKVPRNLISWPGTDLHNCLALKANRIQCELISVFCNSVSQYVCGQPGPNFCHHPRKTPCPQKCIAAGPLKKKCVCQLGFATDESGKKCVDINECLVENGFCSHKCVNTQGSWHCDCKPGYYHVYTHSCKDINECMTNNGNCSNRCINTQGSRICNCDEGYRLVAGTNCRPVLEEALKDNIFSSFSMTDWLVILASVILINLPLFIVWIILCYHRNSLTPSCQKTSAIELHARLLYQQEVEPDEINDAINRISTSTVTASKQ